MRSRCASRVVVRWADAPGVRHALPATFGGVVPDAPALSVRWAAADALVCLGAKSAGSAKVGFGRQHSTETLGGRARQKALLRKLVRAKRESSRVMAGMDGSGRRIGAHRALAPEHPPDAS